MSEVFSRRDVLGYALIAAIAGELRFAPAQAAAPSESAMRRLDEFIAGYCAAMNAPGMSLALADANGPRRLATYGYVDLAAKTPVTPAHLFQIGSITKSFAAFVILQMHEEGKVDLQGPIREYLPWLAMQCEFGDILVHHLLTHTSGMPEDAPVFSAWSDRRPTQTFAPGSEFHYSNWGFGVLGKLIEAVDGRSWAASLTARLLQPIGMSQTAPVIGSGASARIAQSYAPLYGDRPYPRHGPLVPAPQLSIDQASGSIASTPHDMALYLQMLLNRGAVRGRQLISEASFKLFSTAHIAAKQFGPTASYGYGIVVDEFEGHVRLRHTGGMPSFMSSMQLDLDAGIGAFASINAQLGYRPNPVAQFALQLMRSSPKAAMPAMPPFDAMAKVESAMAYAGIYRAADGRLLEVSAEAERLVLTFNGTRIPLQQDEEGSFIAEHPAFYRFALIFERPSATAGVDPATLPVAALSHGSDWFARAGQTHGEPLAPSKELAPYVGEYYSDSPWLGTVEVVQRQRQLWLNGSEPLTPIGNRLFRVGASRSSPESAEFSRFAGEIPQLLWYDGGEFRRIRTSAG